MDIKGKKIVVTGGAGFIGSNLVAELIKNNQVLVIDNFSVGKKENLLHYLGNKNLKIVKVDILDRRKIFNLLRGSDMVFHLAVQCLRKSLTDPVLVHEVNTTGTLNLLLAAHQNKVKRFIYVSSSEVYGTAGKVSMNEEHFLRPTTIYGASKLVGEIYSQVFLEYYGLPVVIVRPFNTYGYYEHFEGPYGEVIPRFVVRILNGLPPVIFGDGKQTRDFIFVTDTVKGLIQVASNSKMIGEVVNIAHGEEVSINRIAEIVLKILGKEKLGKKYLKPRPGDVGRHFADVSKAKKSLGFEAKIGIEEGINKYIDWLIKQRVDFKKMLKLVNQRNW